MKILSIDFDWVMEPCIEAYNKYSYKRVLGPHEAWEEILTAIPAFNSLSMEMDYEKFAELYFFIRDMAQNNLNTPIIITQNHEEIIPALFQHCPSPLEPIEIINIDHHHDFGYVENEFLNTAYDNSNWLYFLTLNPNFNLQTYYWVKNKNSQTLKHPFPESVNFIQSTNLMDVNTNQKFDLIFICSSWEWIPLKYRPLFTVLVNDPGKVELQ